MPVDSKTLDSPWLLLTDRLVRAGRLLDAVGWQKGWPLPAESSDPGGDLYSALSFIQPDIRAHDIIDLLAPLWIEWSAEVGGLLDDTMGPGVPAGGSGRD